jgi:hypothetical protein
MEPVAYLIEGFDGSGKLYAKIVQFTPDEARNSAAEFARHYTTVTTTPLVRATHGVTPCGAPQPWRGLTKDEIDHAVGELVEYGTEFVAPLYAVVEGIERKLRERNAGVASSEPQQKEPKG